MPALTRIVGGLAGLGIASLAAAQTPRDWRAPAASRRCDGPRGPAATPSIELVATTDIHGRVRGWDYYTNASDASRGLTRMATIVDSMRRAHPDGVVLLDAGDLLQGNPFAYVAMLDSVVRPNPMIAAMNAMRYDVAVIGNHEFNYGVPYLNRAIAQAHFPFLAANVVRTNAAHTPAYRRWTLVARQGVTIGIIGATTPGSNLWDAEHLATAKLRVEDIVPSIRTAVLEVRGAGANVVVMVLHSGLDEPSSYDTVSTGVASENVAARVAREISGIDVLVYGHSHKENGGQRIGSTLLVQPKNWATSAAVVRVTMTCDGQTHRWAVAHTESALIQGRGHEEQPSIVHLVQQAHDASVRYATEPIGSTPVAWRADSARMQDTPLIDFILEVERAAAHTDLASTAAFDLHASLGPGPITVAQLSRLYPYDNTLRAVKISGRQLREYLEFSSRYYRIDSAGALVPDPSIPGYNFDMVSGADYTIDVSKPFGRRITTLTVHGKPVAPTDSFTLALNNYRQSGGGGYAMLQGARVVYDKQQEIRQLLIDELRRRKLITPSMYFTPNWSLTHATPTTP